MLILSRYESVPDSYFKKKSKLFSNQNLMSLSRFKQNDSPRPTLRQQHPATPRYTKQNQANINKYEQIPDNPSNN
jgi:hypothetical protein